MSEQTNIEWADSTLNPWIGCTKVSPGCDNCYAEKSIPALMQGIKWGPGAARRRTTTHERAAVTWNSNHAQFFAQHGRRRRVFCASLADVFDREVPTSWRRDLFDLIRCTPHLDWLILTKRIGNAASMIQDALGDLWHSTEPGKAWPWANVWLGATVVNQAEADRDIPKLRAVPARVRFLSIEPMLGPVDLRFTNGLVHGCDAADYLLDWVICGGVSGPHARPMHPDWVRSLRDQCAEAGVPFLFKQWGNWRAASWFDGPDADADDGDDFVNLDRTEHLFIANDGRTWDTVGGRYMYPPLPLGHWCLMVRDGKKASGRLLDGVVHDAWPEPRA